MSRVARRSAVSGDLFAPATPEPIAAAPPARDPTDPSRRIWVGTSGWSFADWVGPFYPAGTSRGGFLEYYAQWFDVAEVNATYYAVPHPRLFESMVRRTPDHFRFVVKLNHGHTHERVPDPSLDRDFLAAIAPLEAAGRYDGALAQFPWAFRNEPGSRAWLASLRERLPEGPLFVEFRHDSWDAPDVAPFLRDHRLGFVAVDEPRLHGLMPPVALATAEDAYVRFHGRNAATWWSGGPLRYDWDYSRVELSEWLQRIAELAQQARRTYLFFNNCHAGQAARSAKLMQELLRQEKLPA